MRSQTKEQEGRREGGRAGGKLFEDLDLSLDQSQPENLLRPTTSGRQQQHFRVFYGSIPPS